MAVSTINPWSAGAVTLNMQPWEAFYERQSLKKQAKEDALDNYFRDLGKNVTPAGMRSQDIPNLLAKTKEWQNFYGQNKAAILNPKLDGGQAYSEYMNRYQDQLGAISQSKEAMKSMDAIGKMKLNPQMSYVFDDPHLVQQIQSHERPIGDPNRQGINLATLTLPPQPVTTKDLDAYNKYLTGNVPFDKIPGQTENLGGFKTRTPIHQQYSPENQMVIGQHAMNAYDTDKRWRSEAVKYFKELQGNPEEYKRANALHKQLYGSDIDDPREAWVAKGILDNNMRATEFKDGKDDFGLQEYMRKMKHADAKELIRLKKQADDAGGDVQNMWYQSYLDNVIKDAKTSGQRHHIYTGGGKSIAYYNMIKPDPFLMKAFQRGKSEPDRLGITEGGEIIPIFFEYDDKGKQKTLNGNPVVDLDYSQPITYEQALVNIGYRGRTKKQLGEDLNKGIPSSQGAPNAPKIEDLRKKYNY